jgi:hypothetical protein
VTEVEEPWEQQVRQDLKGLRVQQEVKDRLDIQEAKELRESKG